METCPKCGRTELKLTAVVDWATMSQQLLCSKCARATTGDAGVAIETESVRERPQTSGCGGRLDPLTASEVETHIAELTSDDKETRRRAKARLVSTRDPKVIDVLIEKLRVADQHQRGQMLFVLVDFGPQAVGPLIEGLRRGERGQRLGAAGALGLMHDPSAVDPLIAALGDEDKSVCWNAAASLGFLEDTRAVEPLLSALETRGVSSAASALGRLRDSRAFEYLIRALNNESQHMRRSAATGLGDLRDERAREALTKALNDSDEVVRKRAAEAIEKLTVQDAHNQSGVAHGQTSGMEVCPKCGRKEAKLVAVIDSATMSQQLLCSKCARATIGPASIGINLKPSSETRKWWQVWKK